MSAETFSIRPAATRDINSMWEIDQACFEPDIAYSVDIFYFHLLVQRDPAFVAFDSGGKMAGFVMTSREARGKAMVVTIDILPPWRGKGLGSRLIVMAEEAMKTRGAKKMVLQTAVDNAPAMAFYEKHGYKNVKTLKDYYGKGKPAFQFEKPL